MPTIIYIAAFALIGLIPLIPYRLSKANFEVDASLDFKLVKNSSGVSEKILGNAYEIMVEG